MIYTITLNPALDREMAVPELVFDRVLRASNCQSDFGGKGFNVSRALLELGDKSIAMGLVGGAVGTTLINGLTGMGISTDFVRIQGETRINLSIIDEGHTHYVKVNEPGPQVTSEECETFIGRVKQLAHPGDWWVLAGTAPPDFCLEYLTTIVNAIRDSGAYTIVDMENRWLREACLAHAFLVKPNSDEAAALLGCQVKTLEEASEVLPIFHEMGARRVVISMGSKGAVYSDGHELWYATAPEIDEHNPIGAGDAMLAGLVWALQRELCSCDILKWGVACGAAAASLDGTAMGSYLMVSELVKGVIVYKYSLGIRRKNTGKKY